MEYIDRGGEQVFQPPFLAEGVRFYGFLLDADEQALQVNLCDRYFNGPSGEPGRYRPAGPYVLLAFCKLNELRSESAPYSNYGWFAEQETAFWVLLVDEKLERLVWGFPYIWVDNSYAQCMGREIYGFPKGYGWFDIGSDLVKLDALSCDTLAIPKFGPNNAGSRQRLIDVRRKAIFPGHGLWSGMGDVVGDLLKGLEIFGGESNPIRGFELAEHSIADFLKGNVPFVFLKQFRDVTEPGKACYQSLVEVDCKLAKFHGGGLLHGGYEVEIHAMDSHPIAHDLGLASGPLRAATSFWVDFDFEIGYGKEIWRGTAQEAMR